MNEKKVFWQQLMLLHCINFKINYNKKNNFLILFVYFCSMWQLTFFNNLHIQKLKKKRLSLFQFPGIFILFIKNTSSIQTSTFISYGSKKRCRWSVGHIYLVVLHNASGCSETGLRNQRFNKVKILIVYHLHNETGKSFYTLHFFVKKVSCYLKI